MGETPFHDADGALALLVEAKRVLDIANAQVRERERANTAMLKDPHWHGKRDECVEDGRLLLEPLIVAAERARSDFDVAFATYQEAARARDAHASCELAKSNNAAAEASTKASRRVVGLTFVLAVAAIVQTIALLSGRQ